MKKLTILLSTAGVLAIGWSAIVLNVMNDPIPESQDRVVHVDAVEVVPEAVPEPVHEVLEPESVQAPVVENKPVEEPLKPEQPSVPFVIQYLQNMGASQEDIGCMIEYMKLRDPRLPDNVEEWHPSMGASTASLYRRFKASDSYTVCFQVEQYRNARNR